MHSNVKLDTLIEPYFQYLIDNPLPFEGSKFYYKKIDPLVDKEYAQHTNNKLYRELTLKISNEPSLNFPDKNISLFKYASAQLLKILLHLCLGQLDIAHSVTTQFSWPYPTSFSDPPQVDTPLYNDFCCLHSLVHRFEGLRLGEYGTGFCNSLYWANLVTVHPVEKNLIKFVVQYVKSNINLFHDTSTLDKNNMNNFINSVQKTKKWSITQFILLCRDFAKKHNSVMKQTCYNIGILEIKLLIEKYYENVK